VAGIALDLVMFAGQGETGHIMVERFDGGSGGVKTAAIMLSVARGALVYIGEVAVQALFTLDLGGDVGVAIHTKHSLILLQGLMAKAAIIFKISVRFVGLQYNSG
jgi:hypothetical protein